MNPVAVVAVVAAGYVVGMFPTAAMVGRRRGVDPTKSGSGNPGASNMVRVGGWQAGVVVAVVDALKGAAPAMLGRVVGGPTLGWVVGAAAVAGHVMPVLRPKAGGKGVATAGGVVLGVDPILAPVAALAWTVGAGLSRTPAVGSALAAVVFPAVMVGVGRAGAEVAVAALVGVVILIRHRANASDVLARRRLTTLRGN